MNFGLRGSYIPARQNLDSRCCPGYSSPGRWVSACPTQTVAAPVRRCQRRDGTRVSQSEGYRSTRQSSGVVATGKKDGWWGEGKGCGYHAVRGVTGLGGRVAEMQHTASKSR